VPRPASVPRLPRLRRCTREPDPAPPHAHPTGESAVTWYGSPSCIPQSGVLSRKCYSLRAVRPPSSGFRGLARPESTASSDSLSSRGEARSRVDRVKFLLNAAPREISGRTAL
jgi:hypothetical protein